MFRRRPSLWVFVAGALGVGSTQACGGDDTPAAPSDAGADALDSAPSDAMGARDAASDDASDASDAGPEFAVYAHTSSALFRFDVEAKSLSYVGRFSCAADGVLNLAIDASGQMFATTGQGLVRVDPTTAACFAVASGVYPKALGFVPKGVLDPNHEVLVGYSYAQYMKIDTLTGAMTPLGALNPNPTQQSYYVGNDLVAGPTGNVFVTALNGPGGDAFLECDPKTGKVIGAVQQNEPATAILGLAQWRGFAYAFTGAGKVYKISFKNGAATPVAVTYAPWDGGVADAGPPAFTGAAVSVAAPMQ